MTYKALPRFGLTSSDWFFLLSFCKTTYLFPNPVAFDFLRVTSVMPQTCLTELHG